MSSIYIYNKPKLYCMLLYRSAARELKKVIAKLIDFVIPLLVLSYLALVVALIPGPHQSV
jgi:hypothetical protein